MAPRMTASNSKMALWNSGSHADIVGFKPKGIQGRVVNSLGERIVCGQFPAGSLLPKESELMEAYDASRTSIREVIKILSAKGLVETRQKIGTRVLDRVVEQLRGDHGERDRGVRRHGAP